MAENRYDVISIGETTIDAFMTLHRATEQCHLDPETGILSFKHGEKIDVDAYEFCLGGNATNVAVGLTRLGIKTGLCSEIGDDILSLNIRNFLVKENVERLLVKQTTGAASSFSVILNFQEDRTIFNQNVERKHDFDLDGMTCPFVYLTSMGEEWESPYKKALQFIEENKAVLAFNPGSRQLREGKDVIKYVLKKTSILFVNKEEAELILFKKETTKDDIEYVKELLQKIQKLGPKTVVITDGKKGSYALSEHGEFYSQDVTPGKIVERTGAGDGFTSGFIAASLYGLSVPQCMEWGASNATGVVSKIGAEAGLLTKLEMERITQEHVDNKVEESTKDEEFEIIPAPVR